MHNGTDIGFWWGAEDGVAFTLDANKAYLAVPKATGVRMQSIWIGEKTGINHINNSRRANGTIYNLQGLRVKNEKKGIVIKNGKKIFNK